MSCLPPPHRWLAHMILAAALPCSLPAQKPLSDTAWITLPDGDAKPQHAITLDEILSLREIRELRLSPKGDQIAFIVMQAFRSADLYRFALYLIDTKGGARPRKLVERASLSGIRWTPDGRFISYLSEYGGSAQLWRIAVTNGRGRPELAFHKPTECIPGRPTAHLTTCGIQANEGVLSYEWSPDGRRIAYTTVPATDSQMLRKVNSSGVLYDDDEMRTEDILKGSWFEEPTQLWVYDSVAHTATRVWTAPSDIGGLSWSPNGTAIALDYSAPPKLRETTIYFNRDVGIVSMPGGAFRTISDSEALERQPVWSPNGKAIAFTSQFGEARSSIAVVSLSSGERLDLGKGKAPRSASDLWWDSFSDRLLLQSVQAPFWSEALTNAVYTVSLRDTTLRKVSKDSARLSDCSFSRDYDHAACIRQTTVKPAEVALLNVSSGLVRTLTVINPEYDAISLGSVKPMRWRNSYGIETTGYLITPPGSRPAHRSPLLIIWYGFSGAFLGQAEWISSYPAQAFARDGFVVLLLNQPRYQDWLGRDFERGSVAAGYSPLASMREAIAALSSQGLVDSARVGALGWSYGCSVVELALTQADLVRAASCGNGGGHNPGVYWISGERATRDAIERTMGGPPFGQAAKNWQRFSPALNADRVRAPVLLEGSATIEGVAMLEMFTALRRHGVPVELILYPDEPHVFEGPQHRYYSMQRNLDWFSFWLQDKRDGDPAKNSQYERWKEMKLALNELLTGSSTTVKASLP